MMHSAQLNCCSCFFCFCFTRMDLTCVTRKFEDSNRRLFYRRRCSVCISLRSSHRYPFRPRRNFFCFCPSTRSPDHRRRTVVVLELAPSWVEVSVISKEKVSVTWLVVMSARWLVQVLAISKVEVSELWLVQVLATSKVEVSELWLVQVLAILKVEVSALWLVQEQAPSLVQVLVPLWVEVLVKASAPGLP